MISLSALMFVMNIVLLFAMIFLLLEVNVGLDVINYIAQNYSRVLFVASAIIILSMLMYAYFYFECTEMLGDMSKIVECFVLLDISLLFAFLIGEPINANARPFAFLALMAATLLGRREAVFLNIIYTLMLFVIDINFTDVGMWINCACMLVTFCTGMVAVFITPIVKTRIQSILTVIVLLVPSELTVFRLRELTSDESKLIKKLKAEAPGTYNHSVVVAQLAQECAAAIGEDGELARAAAYYHDMGKLKNPEMFTENQSDYNMHNELSPELSADIIRSHTRDGAQLIRKNHLPEFFADCAVQHHGTMPIKYFYAKALKMSDGEINIANYSYSGPTPRSKIAAILMIVDAAEAAARSLKERTPKAVEELVPAIIEERLDMDQFADCDITMRELTIISHTVSVVLSGVYHNRVSYPKLKISKGTANERR